VDAGVNFPWNEKMVKTILFSPTGKSQVEMSAAEIVRNPNRHQVESIIQSLCFCVSQLMDIHEADAKRMVEVYSKLKTQEPTTREV
jgi:hypothetical protein